MKKLFALGAIGALALGMAACTDKKGNAIHLVYSGTGSDREFNESLFEKFKEARKEAGDTNEYVIEYVEHGPDRVDSEITDWTTGPDVYEFASDKIGVLYGKGALAKITGANASYITSETNSFGQTMAKFAGDYYGYPWTGDNTYYVQYDKSRLTADDVKTMQGLLDKAQSIGAKVGYNLPEAFWGGAAMFTFGADYEVTYNSDGAVTSVAADFDGEKGQKAASAIYDIVKHPAWSKDTVAPTADSGFVACIAGTWDIASYKTALGSNYGCAVMPTVTVDGETKNLGAFVGGKLFGVNPQRSQMDTDRLVAAHELAKFLSNKECQLERFTKNGIGPCNKNVANSATVKADENQVVLAAQLEFAHPQDAVPGNFWTAPGTLINGMIDGSITKADLATACKSFNDTVKASS